MDSNTVGVDVAKAKLDVAVLVGDRCRCRTFSNDQAGFQALLEWLGDEADELSVCMESTGPYGWALAHFLYTAGLVVSVVNPLRVKAFAISELQRTKNDKVDAKVIARFCRALRPRPWCPVSREMDELRGMMRRHLQLKRAQARVRTQLQEPGLYPQAQASLQQELAFLHQELGRWEKLIRQHVAAYPELQRRVDLVDGIPGVGTLTAALIVSRLPQLERFRSVRQVVAFVGLAVTEKASGSSVRGKPHLSKQGDSQLRAALYFPALAAMKHNPILKAVAERLRGAGKKPMVIIAAVMRHLVGMAYGILKSGKPFDPLYRPRLA